MSVGSETDASERITDDLSAAGVGLAYHDGDTRTDALIDVNVTLPSTGFIGVMGPSGSGKSSLLYVLSGLKRPTTGDVRYRGENLARASSSRLTALRRAHFGFVFQQPWLLGWQTAWENVLDGAPDVDERACERAARVMKDLGIAAFARKMPSQLSGGEKQRVCVARAMLNRPKVIFADEPTASLDHHNGHLVVDMLARYRQEGLVIVVTHDAEMLQDADRILVMRDGRALGWSTPSQTAGVALGG
ncbi:MAG: ABC transporter ATP-binding protein [Capsulimonadaceae bacterium]|nr:ABC transporter ATP-binding protein [Capsulimonadaceae bacterium]